MEAATRYTTIKVRLYPTAAQAELFEKTFGCCRYLWNQMVADQRRFYAETGAHYVPTPAKYKKSAPFLKEVDNQALIQEHNQLCQAFRMFFKHPDFGPPGFRRKKDRRNSFTASNHVLPSGPTIYLTRDGVRMTKAGVVKAALHRRPQGWWKLRRITVSRSAAGRYYCSILYDRGEAPPQPVRPAPETTVGLKYSSAHFFVDSCGGRGDPPRWQKQAQAKLAKLQRRLARMTPGSKNYLEGVEKYRLLHEHIANQRRDFIHKQSRRIANTWDGVCVRADDLSAVKGSAGGFGLFRTCLDYKLARQGKQLIQVERYFPSSRICSVCGAAQAEADYRRRSWQCACCGAELSREVNAARNIRDQGLKEYFRAQRPAA